nr:hypothetical protein [Nocardia pseudovaccinii]
MAQRESALRVVARRGAALWGGSGVVIACWLAGYLTVVDVSAVHTSPSELRDLLPGATSLGIVPTLFGGPWSWERWLPSTPWADPPSWAVVAAWVALGALVLLSLHARLRVGPVWVTAAAYVLVAQLPVALARSGPNTAAELMQSLRYFADIAVVLTAAGALILRAQPRDHTAGLPSDERSRTAELFPGLRDLMRVPLPGRIPVPLADSRRRTPAVRGRIRALFAGPHDRAAAVRPDSQCDATTPQNHTQAHPPDPGEQAAVPHSAAPDSRGVASTSRGHAAAVLADSQHDATNPHDHAAASHPDSRGDATTPQDRAPAYRADPREDATGLDGRAPAPPPDSWGDAAVAHDRTAVVGPDPGGTATAMCGEAPASACDLRSEAGMSRGRASVLLAGSSRRLARWVLGIGRGRTVLGGRGQGFMPGSRAAAVFGVVFLVSSLWSTASFVESWRVNPTRTYVTNVKGALAGSDGVPLLEQEVPWDVLNPTAYPQNLVSRVLAPVTKPTTFADSTSRLRMITDSGEIVEAAVWWNRSILPGPEQGCGYRIRGPQPSDIPLDGPMLEHEWTVQLNYLASEDGRITVSFEHGEPVGAPVRKGLSTVYVRVVGSGSMLRISPRTPGLDLCLGVGPVGVASYDN